MKQSLLKRKSTPFEIRFYNRQPETIKEVITFLYADYPDAMRAAEEYAENHGYNFNWQNAIYNKERLDIIGYQITKIHDLPPTIENKISIRREFNFNNPAYTCCVACGKDLHENTHFESKYGTIGPECFKKYASIL